MYNPIHQQMQLDGIHYGSKIKIRVWSRNTFRYICKETEIHCWECQLELVWFKKKLSITDHITVQFTRKPKSTAENTISMNWRRNGITHYTASLNTRWNFMKREKRQLHLSSETLASLGIIGKKLRTPLKPPRTSKHYGMEGQFIPLECLQCELLYATCQISQFKII